MTMVMTIMFVCVCAGLEEWWPPSYAAWKWFQCNCIAVIASWRQLGFPIIVLKQSTGHVTAQEESHAQPFCVCSVEASMQEDSESKYNNLSCWGKRVVWTNCR